MCNLKFSTSKAILSTYRKEGRVGKKKTRARKAKVINTLILAEVNPFNPKQAKITPMVSIAETKLMPDQIQRMSDGTALFLGHSGQLTGWGNQTNQCGKGPNKKGGTQAKRQQESKPAFEAPWAVKEGILCIKTAHVNS